MNACLPLLVRHLLGGGASQNLLQGGAAREQDAVNQMRNAVGGLDVGADDARLEVDDDDLRAGGRRMRGEAVGVWHVAAAAP